VVSCCLDLYWSNNSQLHSDMIVRVGAECHVADSYWLVCTSNDRKGGQAAGRSLFGSFCKSAAKEFDSLNGNWIRFFPFDFSDQCTKWIRVECLFNQAELSVGWSYDEAPTVISQSNMFPDKLSEWDVVSKESVTIPLSQLCYELNAIADQCMLG